MSSLENALQELRDKRKRAQIEIEKLDQAISGIESLNGTGASHESTRPKRIISAASRRKMATAQRARWANLRKQSAGKTTISAAAKRTMSASPRRTIAADPKARRNVMAIVPEAEDEGHTKRFHEPRLMDVAKR